MVEGAPRCRCYYVQTSLKGSRIVRNDGNFDWFNTNPVSPLYVGSPFGAKNHFPRAVRGKFQCLTVLQGSFRWLVASSRDDKTVLEFFGNPARNILNASVRWLNVDGDRQGGNVTSADLVWHYRYSSSWRNRVEMRQKVVEDHSAFFDLLVTYVCRSEVVIYVYGACKLTRTRLLVIDEIPSCYAAKIPNVVSRVRRSRIVGPVWGFASTTGYLSQ